MHGSDQLTMLACIWGACGTSLAMGSAVRGYNRMHEGWMVKTDEPEMGPVGAVFDC